MKTFVYTITDELGIHARPAGELVKKAKQYGETITVAKGDRSAQATKLLALMNLGIKRGDTVTVTVEGEEEEKTSAEMLAFFRNTL